MKNYLTILLVNKVHFYALLILLIALSYQNFVYIVFLILYLIYLFRHHFLTREMAILTVVFLALFTFAYTRGTNLDLYSSSFSLEVVDKEEKENYTKYKCKYKFEYVIVYDYKNNEFVPGDTVLFNGTLTEISNFSDFDYKTYEKSLHIYTTLKSSNSVKKAHKNSFSYYKYKIRMFYKEKLNSEIYTYFDSLVFGYSLDDDTLKDNISKLQISYLFAISGFHITLIALILEKILSLFVKNETARDISILIFIAFYSFICNFSVGVLRAFLALMYKKINKYKALSFTNLDIYSLTFLSLMFINPLNIFKTGFKYSFIATLFIILGQTLINTNKKILNNYLLTILCFVSTLPLTINLNNEINFLAILIGPLYVFLFSSLIMPIVYILLLVPNINNMILPIFDFFSELINYFASFDIFCIQVRNLNALVIGVFYILLFFVLIGIESKKDTGRRIATFITFLFIIFFVNVNTITKVTMINVGQGDSFLIEENDKTMCIDSYSVNISYLKGRGIKNIDTLLITHSDTDHIGSALELVETFKVERVIFNKYETSDISKEISKKVKNTLYLGKGEVFYFNKHKAEVLGPIINIDTNNNSLVFEITLNKTSFLFTGDSEEKEEDLIYDKYKTYDFVKIAHHGSKTSTQSAFLEHIRFDNALISVGINNSYGHPSSETLTKLKDKKVYMTSTSNSVIIYITSNKYFVYQTIKKRLFLNYLDMV